MAFNKSANNYKDPKFMIIERTAIDSAYRLGSFYDAHRDCLVGQSNMSDKRQPLMSNSNQSSESHEPVQCAIIHGDADGSQNLLQMIRIQDELRLSILLKLAPRIGIASIIDHPDPINEHTRILHFRYMNREERFPDKEKEKEVQKLIGTLSPQTTATHIITGVSLGIDAVIVLQLLDGARIIKKIDGILEKVRNILIGNQEISSFTSDDESVLQKDTRITVYSNIPHFNRLISMHDICRCVNERYENSNMFRPLAYILTPIQLLYTQFHGSGSLFIQLEPSYIGHLEQYLLSLVNKVKYLKHLLDHRVTTLLCGHLTKRLHEMQQQWVNLKTDYEHEIERWKNLILNIRRGQANVSQIDQALRQKESTTLDDRISKITADLNDLETKGRLITFLHERRFQYCNVVECGVDQTDDERTIENKLIMDDQLDRVLCSTDSLTKDSRSQFDNLCRKLVEQYEKNPHLRLTYADFSYCTFKLPDMMTLPSTKYNNRKTNPKKEKTLSSAERAVPSSTSDTINVLLLGETGVGKSTFINAFANYLAFNTLDEAQRQKPMVLIPVSFLITVGDNFQEHVVKFGNEDSSNNEDFGHIGQSVTQHCRSYVFHHKQADTKTIRIIDTPGFGDTRGIDQDDRNMQHILEYINNLSHVNAVCFLLKPNESRLNVFLRLCLTQLFSLLGTNISDKIVFCFTNARSTFYSPGNTAPLLKKMIASLAMDNIPFKKENTFCFDNEAFRYLVAVQGNIQFGAEERQEYERSWSTSVTQSNRLIDYIRQDSSAPRISQSVKRAELEIIHMVRPMLEAVRNILRNSILYKTDSPNRSIKLRLKALQHPATMCHSCHPYPVRIDSFWIARDLPHRIRNDCDSCSCSLDQHCKIDYLFDYEVSDIPTNYRENEITDMLDRIWKTSADFAQYLMHAVPPSKDDPFLNGLKQMIEEEDYMCENQKPNRLNLMLVNELRQIQDKYQQRIKKIKQNPNHELPDIYSLIDTICKYPMIHEQMTAVKEGQKIMMKQNEYGVPTKPAIETFF